MKLDGAGTVTLNGPGACCCRNGSSWYVRLRTFRSRAPATWAVLASTPPPGPRHSSGTRSGTNPSTASAMLGEPRAAPQLAVRADVDPDPALARERVEDGAVLPGA